MGMNSDNVSVEAARSLAVRVKRPTLTALALVRALLGGGSGSRRCGGRRSRQCRMWFD